MLNQNIDNNDNNDTSIKKEEEENKINLDNFSYYLSHYTVDKKYKDGSEQEIESEVLNLVLIRADRAKAPEPGPSTPSSYIGIDIPIIPRDRSINIFFKEDVIKLLNALQYKINSSKSQNKTQVLKDLIEYNNDN